MSRSTRAGRLATLVLLAIAAGPGTARAQSLERGVELYQAGNIAASLTEFQAAERENPSDKVALLWKGLALERLGERSEARQTWGNVIQDPHWGTTAAYLGVLSHWKQGEYSSNVHASAGFCTQGRPMYAECQEANASFDAGRPAPRIEEWASLAGLEQAVRARPVPHAGGSAGSPASSSPARQESGTSSPRPTAPPKPPTRAPSPAVATAVLQLEKSAYNAGETIRVSFRGPGGYMDSIELWQMEGAPANRGAGFVWGKKEGVVELRAPRPGRYEVRYAPESGPTLAKAPIRIGAAATDAPSTAAGTIPSGTYETYFYGTNAALNKWLAGDIIVQAGGRYRFQGEVGAYGYDAASKRIVFRSGPLQGAFARLAQSSGRAAIVLPKKENEAAGRDLQIVSDIWGYLKR